jgi:hypothetical protein
MRVKAPKTTKQGRKADVHAVAARGRELQVPARAQALAVSALLAGDLAGGPKAISGFYAGLDEIESWETLPPTIAVHRVLGTPDPFRYERFWPAAIKLLKKIAVDVHAVESHVSTAGLAPSRCYVTQSDVSALPLPPGSAFTVRTAPAPTGKADTTGATDRPSTKGAVAQPTETRFDAACGTPVVAATRGVVEIVSDNAEAGPWLIKVPHLIHAQDILTELRGTLRVEAWEGGPALASLYDWLLTQLVRANVSRDAEVTAECLPVVESLVRTWHEAAGLAATA